MRTWRASAHSGVYSLVDLRADPIDQAFCDRAVIVAAKFVMCCCCGSDVVPGCLIHRVTLHLNHRTGYYRKLCRGGSDAPIGPGLLDANYRRVPGRDQLGSSQAVSMVVHASGCALTLLYVLLYGFAPAGRKGSQLALTRGPC